jgi:hypothetical protein
MLGLKHHQNCLLQRQLAESMRVPTMCSMQHSLCTVMRIQSNRARRQRNLPSANMRYIWVTWEPAIMCVRAHGAGRERCRSPPASPPLATSSDR